MACCSCCEKTGACCNDGVCSEETCADCESAGGVFQGVDTTCAGVGEDECPCDPPASPSICEKCVAGVPTDYCPETDCCTDGTCKPCPPPYCPEEPCTGTDCCVDGQCVPCPEPTCPAEPCTGTDCCVDGQCLPCPEPTCPDEPCTGADCCVDGFCVPCPEYDCVPECDSGDCCVDGVCEPCESCDPGDCPSGQCCVDGFCTDCPDPCSPGDCGEGYCCVDGFCLPCPDPPTDPCAPGSCGSGLCCVDGHCLPCPPRECPDPTCPSGECCIDGYCINPCPAGECCVDGECEPGGACCASDGTCSQTCEGDCDGVWQGAGTSCDDYDCESGCCEEVTLDTCTLDICRRGYNASTCGSECDPTVVVTPPTAGQVQCEGGGPTSSTVTGSGVTFNTGDPLFDADLGDMMNASYAISWDCDGTHTGSPGIETDYSYTGNYGPYTVRVTLYFASTKVAAIQAFLFSVSPPLLAGMELNDGAADVYSSECDTVYECENFSGPPSSTGGTGDYTSANIAVT